MYIPMFSTGDMAKATAFAGFISGGGGGGGGDLYSHGSLKGCMKNKVTHWVQTTTTPIVGKLCCTLHLGTIEFLVSILSVQNELQSTIYCI